jgi:hypothetical protein
MLEITVKAKSLGTQRYGSFSTGKELRSGLNQSFRFGLWHGKTTIRQGGKYTYLLFPCEDTGFFCDSIVKMENSEYEKISHLSIEQIEKFQFDYDSKENFSNTEYLEMEKMYEKQN